MSHSFLAGGWPADMHSVNSSANKRLQNKRQLHRGIGGKTMKRRANECQREVGRTEEPQYQYSTCRKA